MNELHCYMAMYFIHKRRDAVIMRYALNLQANHWLPFKPNNYTQFSARMHHFQLSGVHNYEQTQYRAVIHFYAHPSFNENIFNSIEDSNLVY